MNDLSIILSITEVQKYHSEPEKLIEKIKARAAHDVFDIKTKQGRDECRAHAATIIKCITPALNASKELAADAKKVINADLAFRKTFESGVREIADYHRRPLTEWEEEQKRIEEEEKALAQYLEDWDYAVQFNELDTLRKEKEKAAAIAAAELAKKEQAEREESIRKQAKFEAEQAAERQRIKAEQEAKAQIERAEREAKEAAEMAERQRVEAELDSERLRLEAIRKQEQAVIAERQRLEKIAADEKKASDKLASDKEHQRTVNNEILAAMIKHGIDEKTAKEVIRLASKLLLGKLYIHY